MKSSRPVPCRVESSRIYLPPGRLQRQVVVDEPVVELPVGVEPALVSLSHQLVPVVGDAVVDDVPKDLRDRQPAQDRRRPERQERQRRELLGDPQDGVRFRVRAVLRHEDDRADVVGPPPVGLEERPTDVGLQGREPKLSLRIPVQGEVHGVVAQIAHSVEEYDRSLVLLLNTLDDTAFGSRRSGVVSEMIRSAEDDDDDDDAAVENIGRCRRAAVDAAAVRAEETTAGGIEGTENAVAPRPKQRIISASDASSSRRNARRGRKILVADMKKPRGERNLFVLFFADGRLRSRSCSSLLVAAANSHPSGRSKISSS
eukprot:CAMPEP_0197185966 /NCGR_PEP_ID=MMETSP1423-20130617/12936_1 /TAXON_ID=476441 /ORGANISM="Pseudo-nitzschia heimii, Strain UNC1101" /LENGTH=314 /DNA_ID=CAMNT_0042637149 /DNA_START=283 /DNA_END=1224 /DNA_ORIENTATION=-